MIGFSSDGGNPISCPERVRDVLRRECITGNMGADMCRCGRVSLCRATALGVKCLAGHALVDVASHGIGS